MLEKIEERAATRGQVAAAAQRARLAEAISAAGRGSGIAAEVSGDQVVLTGRSFTRRLVTDASLRWIIEEAVNG